MALVAALVLFDHARADDAPPDAAPEQIEIHDTLPEPAQSHVSGAEARQIPGGLGDPVRAVTALPGFVPVSLRGPYFYLRGAPPENVESLVDGVRVPLLFHGGVASSVIAPGLVDAVDLYPSAVPARFGGVVGGVIELATRPPATDLHGEVAAKIYETSALVESPFAENGTMLAAARFGYPQLVTAIVAPQTHLGYWDYQARAAWKVGDHDRVSAFAFGSHDQLSHDDAGVEIEDLASDFHRVDVRYDHDVACVHLRAAVTAGWSLLGAAGNAVVDRSLGAHVDGTLRLAPSLLLRGGARLDGDNYVISSSATDDPAAGSPADAVPPPVNITAGASADVVWRVTHDLELVPGVRVGAYRSRRSVASATIPVAEPTLAARYRVSPGVTSLTSVGVAHQYPLLRVGNAPVVAVSVPGFPTDDRRLQMSVQAAQGVEVLLPMAIVTSATAFLSHTTGESDLPGTCYGQMTGTRDMPGPIQYLCADARSDALAYGLELSARRALTERLAGWFSYTLSRTTERYRDGTTLPSPYDRRHVVNATVTYAFGAHWRAGARVVFYTGTPYLQFGNGQRVAPLGDFRLPAFGRGDVRVEKQWNLTHERSITLVFEVLNATLSRERDRVDCGAPYAPDGTCVTSDRPLFILPSVGLEARF